MSVIIEKRVYLEPRYLDSNIMQHLLNTLTETTVGECSKEYGHILSINRVVDVLGNEDTIFTVRFEAETLKPEAGKEVNGTVCMVYKDGIFINIVDKQKMLIPTMALDGYKFDEIQNVYMKDDMVIREGDRVNAIITAAKYNKHTFSCFGSLA